MSDDCNHDKTIQFGGKTSDMFWARFPGGGETEGYADLPGIAKGDYVRAEVCLDCLKIIMSDEQHKELKDKVTSLSEAAELERLADDIAERTTDEPQLVAELLERYALELSDDVEWALVYSNCHEPEMVSDGGRQVIRDLHRALFPNQYD